MKPINISIRLDGQLGNQLFQLALGLKLFQHFNCRIQLDDMLTRKKKFRRFQFEAFDIFNTFQYCSEFKVFLNRVEHNLTLRNFFKPRHLFIESEQGLDSLDFVRPYHSYTGFFQSPSLFPERQNLIQALTLRDQYIDTPLAQLIELAEKTQSLAVSVRRGDFVESTHLGVCSDQYYFDGIRRVKAKQPIDNIFIFSDDINYCRKLFDHIDQSVIYVEGYTPAQSLYLMGRCKNLVISNSTFSWWGAWISNYFEGIVIAPDPWNDDQPIASDFIPPEWVRLPKHP